MTKVMEPLDTGLTARRERRERFIRKVKSVLLNRRFLVTVLWVAKAAYKIAVVVGKITDDS
ncbi:MAG: hypothetical protein EBR82_04475 [Caulobacteraceae bacterium]|nr:hypothetical protein [Caulobacteraceae bacterium]